ncbi:hypothetical protein GF1_31270 [Desulfolithobacter dissulfuricans]|uniref:Uncharacterized protein n=1 Tax=Desulfolithobacter dissulfuricans TaxID=2795293 RepID=A0A915XLY7_9BACT|nr:hypothetical protein [Desulfolithobacter dissulfuricans]BCO10751.1 hypothetical protein GF1_31270 [Desulfolithobacter dissulfuricans]
MEHEAAVHSGKAHHKWIPGWLGWGFLLLLVLGLAVTARARDERILFLHHSTGNIIYTQGDVRGWIERYNGQQGTGYVIDDRYYPNTPYPWSNYPYDYWNLWVNGACRPDEPNIHCLDQLTADYQVIIFKNCYPVSNIEADTGTPDITSSRKSLENYRLQYSAVRDLLTRYPDTLFIFWTGAPLHRLATTPEKAARARAFAQWVKNDMLATGEYQNIRVFDYFDLTAGDDNVLRHDYETSHTSSDSHPNSQAARDVGPVFASFIVDSAREFFDHPVEPVGQQGGGNGQGGLQPVTSLLLLQE